MLGVLVLTVAMMNFVKMSSLILNVGMLRVDMPNFITLSGVLLNVYMQLLYTGIINEVKVSQCIVLPCTSVVKLSVTTASVVAPRFVLEFRLRF